MPDYFDFSDHENDEFMAGEQTIEYGSRLIGDPNDPRFYPTSDGAPMGESTHHIQWIITILCNLKKLFNHREDVFVAGDLFWYPEFGNKYYRAAPDIMVVFGRPSRRKENVGAYRQWHEEHQPPQVVLEVLSPSDTNEILNKKVTFYEDNKVEELYLCNPHTAEFQGMLLKNGTYEIIENLEGWQSPRLGVRFEKGGDYNLLFPDGSPFMTPEEKQILLEQDLMEVRVALEQAEEEHLKEKMARQKAEEAMQQAEKARQEAEKALKNQSQAHLEAEEEIARLRRELAKKDQDQITDS